MPDCDQLNLVLFPSAAAQYGCSVTPPAAVSLFAIAGCICLGKESFGCSVTLLFEKLQPTKPGSISQRGSAVWVQRHAA